MAKPEPSLSLGQINIVVRDMRRSLEFYRRFGLTIEDGPESEWSRHHARALTANGVSVEFDSLAFAQQWNPGLDPKKLGCAAIPFFLAASREEVDRVHARVTAAGAKSQQAPADGFWGARYAIVEDPDGNAVGIISAIDPSMRLPPPPPPR